MPWQTDKLRLSKLSPPNKANAVPAYLEINLLMESILFVRIVAAELLLRAADKEVLCIVHFVVQKTQIN